MEKLKLTRSVVETGILISLAFVLSLIQIPFYLGAQITFASTLPIILIAFRENKLWSFLVSFLFGVFQLLIGIVRDGLLAWGLISTQLFWCILLDYIVAFTLIGICNYFKNSKEKWQIFGIFLVFLLRYFCHIISGCIIFNKLSQWSLFGQIFERKAFLYSVCFNGIFIIPEFAITCAVFLAVIKIPYLKKLIFKNN